MRDPKRIDEFCKRLAAAWHNVPDLRFGQLVTNFESVLDTDIFYIEDEKLIKEIESYLRVC